MASKISSKLTSEQIATSWENLKSKQALSESPTLSDIDEMKLSNLSLFDASSWTQKQKDQKLEEMVGCGFIEQFEALLKAGAKIDLGVIVLDCLGEPSKWSFAKLAHQYGQKATSRATSDVWYELIQGTDSKHIGMTLERFHELELHLPQEIVNHVWDEVDIANLHPFIDSPYHFLPKKWTTTYQRQFDRKFEEEIEGLKSEYGPDVNALLENLSKTFLAIQKASSQRDDLKNLNVLKNYQGTKLSGAFYKDLLSMEEMFGGCLFGSLLRLGVIPPTRGYSDSFESEKSWPWLAAEAGNHRLFEYLMKDETQRQLCAEDAAAFQMPKELPRMLDDYFYRLLLPTFDQVGFDFTKDKFNKMFLQQYLSSFAYAHDLDNQLSLEQEQALLKQYAVILDKPSAREKSIAQLFEESQGNYFKIPLPTYGSLRWTEFKDVLEKERLQATLPAGKTVSQKIRI